MEKLLKVLLFVALFIAMWLSRTYAYDVKEYLNYCNFTSEQSEKVIELSKTTRNPDHYIKRVGAIAAHEMWTTFKDWQTKFFAGRLAPAMKYKDFNTQVEAWTNTYNKYRYKNNTASDWIKRSRYCVSDTHWWGEGCPNWIKNVPHIASLYTTPDEPMAMNKGMSNEHLINPPKLNRVVASKEPVKTTGKRCKIIYRAERDGYIQIDRFQAFRNRIRWVKKNDAIFRCYDIK